MTKMTSKLYEAENHIYYNPSGDTVYILPGSGQTLVIDGQSTGNDPAGVNGNVQWNNNGVFGADPLFTYETNTGQLDIPVLYSEKVYINTTTNQQGENQLSNLETLDQANTTNFREQGISVAIAETGANIYSCAGGPRPNNGTGTFYGGVITYRSESDAAFVFNNAYTYQIFCDDYYAGQYTDISENSNILVMSLSKIGSDNIEVRSRSGNNYNLDQNLSGWLVPRCSGNFILASNRVSGVAVFHDSGGYSLTQQIIANGDSFTTTLMDITDSGALIYVYQGTTLSRFVQSGSGGSSTWSSNATLSITGMTQLGTYSTLVVYSTSTQVVIIESMSVAATFNVSDVTAVCCFLNSVGGDIVFYSTPTYIGIITKISGVWTESANTTTLSGITALACNDNRLMVGRSTTDTYGRCNVYTVSFYQNEVELLNEIVLDNGTNNNLEINCSLGDINVTGNVGSLNIDIANEISVISENNFTLNSESGVLTLQRSSATVAECNDNGFEIYTNLYMGGLGSTIFLNPGLEASPSMVFTNATDTGIFKGGANALSIVSNGQTTSTFDETGVTFNVLVDVPNLKCAVGSFSAPGIYFGSDSDTGIYQISSGYTSFCSQGSPRFHIGSDFAYFNNSPSTYQCFFADGTASSPSIGFTADQDTGFFRSSAGRIGISSDNFEFMRIGKTGVSSQTLAGITLVSPNDPTSFSVVFRNATIGGTVKGFIGTTETTTAYVTSSDRRLKESIVDSKVNGLSKLNQIKIREWVWKSNGKKCDSACVADELRLVCPEAVFGEPDSVDADGNVIPLGIDYSKLVPLLILSVQQLKAEIDTLTVKVRSLEQKYL